MSLKISSQLFTGPFEIDATEIRSNQRPAVFCIISKEGLPWDPMFRVVAVGESGDNGMRFAEHPDRNLWNDLAKRDNPPQVYLFPMSKSDGYDAEERQKFVDAIIKDYCPPKGLVSIRGGG